MGIILNRPTIFTTDDMGTPLNFISPALPEAPGAPYGLKPTTSVPRKPWNVWCGGDCEGLNSPRGSQVCFCLHTDDSIAEISSEIIRGVYLIDFENAQQRIELGEAEQSDFLLLVGYCGWGKDQMQSELDRGDTWSMAAADQKALLGELRELQVDLKARREAASLAPTVTAKEVQDGIAQWRKLYVALGDKFEKRLADARLTGDDEHSDQMLHRWIERCLIPSEPDLSPAAAARVAKLDSLQPGNVLRASPTSWLLGKPSEGEEFSLRRFRPAQYLHKGVLLLLSNFDDEESSVLALLNGPAIGNTNDGRDVTFGGMSQTGSFSNGVLEVGEEDVKACLAGQLLLGPGLLRKLVAFGALEVAEGVKLQDIISLPQEERWLAAGGRIESTEDAAVAAMGDVQLQKWYERFVNIRP